MSRRPRRNHTPVFKSKVALAAIKGDKTLAEPAQLFDAIPIKSRSGRRNYSKELPGCSDPRLEPGQQPPPSI